jgi:hypothetical protein
MLVVRQKLNFIYLTFAENIRRHRLDHHPDCYSLKRMARVGAKVVLAARRVEESQRVVK